MKVVLIRSGILESDSRLIKTAFSLVEAHHKVVFLGWDRTYNHKIEENNEKVLTQTINAFKVGIKVRSGAGFYQNLMPMLKFQFHIFIWLIRNRAKYECIHACDFDTAIIGYFFKTFFKKKLVYDIYDYYIDTHKLPKTIRNIIEYFDSKIIKTADSTIICSEKRKEQIQGTKPKRLYVVHNSPDYTFLDNYKYDLNKEKVKIVYVGCLVKNRFIEELIKVISNRRDCELHIGGYGEKSLERLIINAANKFSNIVFYGRLIYSKALALENSCDIMVALYDPKVRNHYYAAPNKFYEALMLGKPLIMAKNTGMDSIVDKNNIGVVINYDKESLNQGIDNLVARKNDWPVISKKMKNIYQNDYSWEKMQARLLNLYNIIQKVNT